MTAAERDRTTAIHYIACGPAAGLPRPRGPLTRSCLFLICGLRPAPEGQALGRACPPAGRS
eukprot:6231044-Pyramimonas_sp.AAC.1